jgi:hypothetical protein
MQNNDSPGRSGSGRSRFGGRSAVVTADRCTKLQELRQPTEIAVQCHEQHGWLIQKVEGLLAGGCESNGRSQLGGDNDPGISIGVVDAGTRNKGSEMHGTCEWETLAACRLAAGNKR